MKAFKKINGFTTMELSIVMLMAVLISTVAYSGYTLFTKQIYQHNQTSTEALELQKLLVLAKRDVWHCEWLQKNGDEVSCISEKNKIVYSFENDQYILRTQAGCTDTFKLDISGYVFLFGQQPVTAHEGYIDEIVFTGTYKKTEIKEIFKKQYSFKQLVTLNEQNGH